MTDIERQILENQEIIILAISKLLLPHCKGMLLDTSNQTKTNNLLIDNYHLTRKLLGKDYIRR